jgi:hypothetical protein
VSKTIHSDLSNSNQTHDLVLVAGIKLHLQEEQLDHTNSIKNELFPILTTSWLLVRSHKPGQQIQSSEHLENKLSTVKSPKHEHKQDGWGAWAWPCGGDEYRHHRRVNRSAQKEKESSRNGVR